MAVLIELAYGKKLGLPEYSSHNFSVSLKVEVARLDDIPAEVHRVYGILQQAVDTEITNPGYVPGRAPAVEAPPPAFQPRPAQQQQQQPVNRLPGAWGCSPKQRELIENLMRDQRLRLADVDGLAQERFGKGLTQLNKLQASCLIDELLDSNPGRNRGGRRT